MRFHRRYISDYNEKNVQNHLHDDACFTALRGRWIKRDANGANWINFPTLSGCDAWSLHAQMSMKEISEFNDYLFVCAYLSAWWRLQKIRREEEERYHVTRRRGTEDCGVTRAPEWRAMVERRDGITRWVEHIKLISGHVENSEGSHAHTAAWCVRLSVGFTRL